ncbi:MAG: SPOR domain-containing protein [Azospirillaceae bacterium]
MTEWRLDSIGDDSPEPPDPPEAGGHADDEMAFPRGRGRRGSSRGDGSGGRRAGARRYAGGAVALVVLIAFGGLVWYAYDAYRTRGGGIAPLIRADETPTRIKPDQPGGMEVPHRDRAVLQDGEPGNEAPAIVESAEAPLPRPGERPTPPDSQQATSADSAEAPAAEDRPAGSPTAAPAPEVEVAELGAASASPEAPSGDGNGDTARAPAANAGDDAEALIPRIQPASSTDDTPPTTTAAGAADASQGGTQLAQSDNGADDVPAIADTPQLDSDPAESASSSADGATGEASGEASAATTDPGAEREPPRFGVPLGTVEAPRAAADLAIVDAQVPADFDPAAALAGEAAGTQAEAEPAAETAATAEAPAPEPEPAPASETEPAAETETAAETAPASEPEAPADPGPAPDTQAETETASTAPAATAGSGDGAFGPVAGGTWRIQLAATNSRESAEEEWRRFASRNPDLLGALDLVVPQVTIEGTDWYRVQAGPLDRETADALCGRLIERGTDCLVRQQ